MDLVTGKSWKLSMAHNNRADLVPRYYGPSVDGQIIRDLPSNEFKQGHFSKIPLIVDRDGFEGKHHPDFL